MAYVRIRMRRSTKAQWEAANPILAEGELGYEVPDAGVGRGLVNFKMGDNVTPWNELPYAFKGLSMTEDIAEVSELVGEMSNSVTDMQETVDKMNAIVVTLRRVDIQEVEPDEPNLGQVWIKTDAITGAIEFENFDANMDLGGDQLTVNVKVTLGQCTGIKFSLADSSTSAISIVSSTPENNIVRPSCVINADTTGSGVLVCEAYLGDYVIYRISKKINVSLTGSYTISGSKSRLIMYSGQTQDPDIAECVIQTNFRDDMWSLRADETPVSWEVNSQYLKIIEESQTSLTVRAIAPTNGTSTYVKCKFRVKGAGALEQTYGISIVGMTAAPTLTTTTNATHRITIANSLIDGTDYIGPIDVIYNNSYLSVDRIDESHYDISTHNYAGEYDIAFIAYKNTDKTAITQSISMRVIVAGKIAFNAPNGIPTLEVNQSYQVDLINSFIQGIDYTNVRYYSENTGIAIVESVNSGQGCKITGRGVGSTFIRAVLQKNGIDLTDETKRAVVSVGVKGNIRFNEGTPSTMVQGQTYVIAITSTLGGDLYAINWSWDPSLLEVVVASNRLSATVKPLVSGSTTRITAVAIDSNSIEIGRCETDAISLNPAEIAGTFGFVNSNYTINLGETVDLVIDSSYDFSKGYTVFWQTTKVTSSDPDYIRFGTGDEKNNEHCVIYTTDNSGGSAYVNAILLLNGNEITRAQAMITVQGTVEFRASEYNGNVGTPETIILNNTLISGTWKRFVWTIADPNIAHFATGFDRDNDQSGAANIIYGPNPGVTTISAMPKDANNNDMLSAPITTRLSSIGAVTIDTSTIIDDLDIGDDVYVTVNNPMDSSQYDSAVWSLEGVAGDQLVFVGETEGRTTVSLHANGYVCAYIVYALYKNGEYLKGDRARIVVQGAITMNQPSSTVMNVGDSKTLSASSSLVIVDNKTYTYDWVCSDPTVFAIIKNAANPTEATITAFKRGTADIYVTASVMEDGVKTVKYTSDTLSFNVIGDLSINIPGVVDPGNTMELTIDGTLNANEYGNISWSVNDTSIATIAVDPEDDKKATITAIRKGEVTVYVVITDENGNLIKSLADTVLVNGVIYIYPLGSNRVKFFNTLNVAGSNTLRDGTYGATEWISTDSNIFTVSFDSENPANAVITPVSVGTASVIFRAYKMVSGNKEVVYSSDPVSITVTGDIRFVYPDNMPDYIDVDESVTLSINNKYIADEDYSSITYEIANPADTGKLELTPGTNKVTIKGLAAGEAIGVTVNVIDEDSTVIDSDTAYISVQGEIKIVVPGTGTALTGTNFTVPIEATNSLISFTYGSEREDGGIIWESSDDTIMSVAQNESDPLRATLTVLDTGTVTITVKAVDENDNVVDSDTIEYTISE